MGRCKNIFVLAFALLTATTAWADSVPQMTPDAPEAVPFLVIQPVSSSFENDQIILGVLAMLLIGAAAAQLSSTND